MRELCSCVDEWASAVTRACGSIGEEIEGRDHHRGGGGRWLHSESIYSLAHCSGPSEASAGEVGSDEFVLACEVGVQGGFGDAGFGDDPVDSDCMNAFGVEKAASNIEKPIVSA